MPFSDSHSLDFSSFRYKIELHAHTQDVSDCSNIQPEELIEHYHALGFDGVAITNHYYPHNCCRYENGRDYAAYYCKEYHQAKKVADSYGMKVYLGAELRFPDCSNDFLTYGIDDSDIADFFDLEKTDLATLRAKAKNQNLVIIQAHPFRDNMIQREPPVIDGIEVSNNHPGHNARPGSSYEFLDQHPGIIATAGTDCHRLSYAGYGAILTETLPEDSFALAALLRSRRFLFAFGKSIVVPASFNYQKS